MKTRIPPDPVRLSGMSTREVREAFLLDGLFAAGEVRMEYVLVERAIAGAAVPATAPLALPAVSDAPFCARREVGVMNLGGEGVVTVDGVAFPLAPRDALYIGRGSRAVEFASREAGAPARFWFVSYPAHRDCPTTPVHQAEAEPVRLGSREQSNERTIYKYIHEGGVESCQLVMGWTELEKGSVWNTMPPHTHLRRSEIYLYFGLPGDACVFHFLGRPDETRHVVVRNEEAVISPSWSMHAGAGLTNYGFVWSMGGENQEFGDMQAAPLDALR